MQLANQRLLLRPPSHRCCLPRSGFKRFSRLLVLVCGVLHVKNCAGETPEYPGDSFADADLSNGPALPKAGEKSDVSAPEFFKTQLANFVKEAGGLEAVLAAAAGEAAAAANLQKQVEKTAREASAAVEELQGIRRSVLEDRLYCEERVSEVEAKRVKAVASLDAATAALNGTASELRLLGEKEFQAFSKRIADVAKVYGLEHVARKQRDVDAELALLKTEQELAARDLRLLNSSYLAIESDMSSNLKKVREAAEEIAAYNYVELSRRMQAAIEEKVASLQQILNARRLDDLATERAIADVVRQLKAKGVAAVDVSDIFPDASFDVARKEFMARVHKKIKAHFIPIFFVTQTPEDFKDFVYSRYHMLPCVRAIEKIVDELNFVNDNSAYVVVRIENVLIEVIVEEGRDGFFENSALVDSHASRGSKMLPYVLHDSQEALVMPQTPFFGAEMVKKFDALTKSDLESAVGDLGGKAVLLVHMGDRRGYIARPNPCSGESLQKFGLLKKLVSSFSAPVQEVSFLWRQMEHEAAFLKHFFTEDPSLIEGIPVSISFATTHLPPVPPSPLFRGEFGILQIQAQVGKEGWIIPSARCLETVLQYVNSHDVRGGLQAVMLVSSRNEGSWWRSKIVYNVKVVVRSADDPGRVLRLSKTPDDHPDTPVSEDELPVLAVNSQQHVVKYLTTSLAKVVLPPLAGRIKFRRLLIHICVVNDTC